MPSETPPATTPRGLRLAGIIAVIVAAIIVIAGVVSRAGDTTAAQHWADAQAIPVVHLIQVGTGTGTSQLALPGTMQAFSSAKIYARVGGYLKAWYKDIGAHVGAGTALGQIETPELDQQILEARANLSSSRAHLQLAASTAKRWAELLTTTSVSKQEADEKNGDLLVQTSAVQSAAANLARLQTMQGFARLTSPFAGIVIARNADIGDLVSAGQGSSEQPLFAVADVHKIRIYVNVPQSYSAALHPGLTARLAVPDYPGRTFSAQVIGTAGAISAQSGSLLVQLLADNPGEVLKPGGYVQVGFDLPGQPGVVEVPSSALLFRKEGLQIATVNAANHIHLRSITAGRDLGGSVEVTAGLGAHDKVVDNPPDSLTNGALVRVAGSVAGA
ncbi:MAG: efflux RND transporter periplasmic adaptor subunit [Janthinobacterium lividum]